MSHIYLSSFFFLPTYGPGINHPTNIGTRTISTITHPVVSISTPSVDQKLGSIRLFPIGVSSMISWVIITPEAAPIADPAGPNAAPPKADSPADVPAVMTGLRVEHPRSRKTKRRIVPPLAKLICISIL